MTDSNEIHSPCFHLSFDELCTTTNLSPEYVRELVDYDIAIPTIGKQPQEWQFNITSIKVVNKATRLHRDLDIDLADLALVLNLLEEIEELKSENNLLRQQLNRFLA